MYAKNQVWYRVAPTLEELPSLEFKEKVCFSFLCDEDWFEENKGFKYLDVRFPNEMEKYLNKNISTQQWIELFIEDLKDKIVSWHVEKDFFYITLDMSVLSHEWALSILTIFRYAGEYYNICWMTQYIMENTKLSAWEALFLAHQVTMDCPLNCSYGNGHSLFMQGNTLDGFNLKQVFKKLDEIPAYTSLEECGETSIQSIWYPSYTYAGKIVFDRSLYAQ